MESPRLISSSNSACNLFSLTLQRSKPKDANKTTEHTMNGISNIINDLLVPSIYLVTGITIAKIDPTAPPT